MTLDSINQPIGIIPIYASLIEALPGKSILVKPDSPKFTILAATPEYISYTGYANKQLIGKGVFEAFPGNYLDPENNGEQQLRASFEYVIKHKISNILSDQRYDVQNDEGVFSKKFWRATNTPVFSGDEVLYILHTAEDITDKVLAVEFRKQIKVMEHADSLRRLYETITNNTPDLIYVFDLNYRFTYANQALLKMFGRTLEDVIGKGLRDLGYDEFHVSMQHDEINKVIQTKKAIRATIAFPNAKFGTRYYDYIFAPVLNELGEVESIAGTTRDITELKISEQQIKEREEQLLFAIDAAELGVWDYNPHTQKFTSNAWAKEWFGLNNDGEEDLSVGMTSIIESDRQRVSNAIFRALEWGNGNYDTEFTVVNRKTGIERILRANGKATFNEEKIPIRFNGTLQDVTEQVKAKEKLEESEQHLELLSNTVPAMIFYLDEQQRYRSYNQTFMQWFGVNANEAIGMTVKEFIGEIAYNKVQPHLAIAYGGKQERYEMPAPERLGKNRWVDIVYSPHKNEEGKVVGVIVLATDITQSKQTELALRESETRFRFAMNAGQLGSWELDLSTVTLHATELCKKIFGQPLDKPFTYETLRDSIHHDDKDRMSKAVEATILQRQDYNIEYRIIWPDGSLHWVSIRGQLKSDANGQPLSIIGVSSDITQRKMAEQALAESELKLRNMVMQSQTGICILSGSPLKAEIVNDAFLRISGKSREDFDNHPYWDVLKEAEPFYGKTLENVFQTGQRFSVTNEPVVLYKNGQEEISYLDFNYEPIKDENGITQKVTVFVIDVTEQVTSLRKLEEKEKALEAALDQVQLSKEAAELGTFDLDLVKGTMHWDERCRVLFGISHNKPVSYEQDFIEGLHPDDRERITKIIDNLYVKSISDGNYDVEYRTVGQKDGIIRWVKAKGKVYFNNEDQPLRFIGSVLDITPQMTALQKIERTVEERTRELAKANETLHLINKELQRSNANLEEFAHAASHDLKEPVRKILFFTDQLKHQLSDHLKEAELRSFYRIENASQRMSNLIDDLLLYSHVRQRPHEKELVDLNIKVQNVLEDLELDIIEKKAIVNVGELPKVQGYTRQLQQMFQNLISNALKYSNADISPVIEISAAKVVKNDQHFYMISIKDNGIGFEQEYAEKIFQIFTRLHGKGLYTGTGVGLSIVKKVVENHDGLIEVESKLGVGSEFKVYLPG